VLFACGLNAIRSPMAEAILKQLFPRQIFSQSAGVRRGEVDPFMVAVMEEIGIDMSKHRPQTFEDLDDMSFDLIITLAPEAHHKALEYTRTEAIDVEYWPTADPAIATGSREQILNSYRAVRDDLIARLKKRFNWAPVPGD